MGVSSTRIGFFFNIADSCLKIAKYLYTTAP